MMIALHMLGAHSETFAGQSASRATIIAHCMCLAVECTELFV